MGILAMNDVELSDSFIIDGIDYGRLVKTLEVKAHFHNYQKWEDMLNSISTAICIIRENIIKVSQETEKRRFEYKGLGLDRPTDIYWVLSILFAIRTIGIFHSKSTNSIKMS